MKKPGIAAVLLLAVIAGGAIGYFDSRPSWDDTGITVFAVILVSLFLSALQPRAALVVGVAAGVPVLVMNRIASGSWAALPVVAFALLGAGLGYLTGGGAGNTGAKTEGD